MFDEFALFSRGVWSCLAFVDVFLRNLVLFWRFCRVFSMALSSLAYLVVLSRLLAALAFLSSFIDDLVVFGIFSVSGLGLRFSFVV